MYFPYNIDNMFKQCDHPIENRNIFFVTKGYGQVIKIKPLTVFEYIFITLGYI